MTTARNIRKSTALPATAPNANLNSTRVTGAGGNLWYKNLMAKKRPKHYRQQIYDYIEEMLGRPLTFDEHDELRDMLGEYVFSVTNLRGIVRRFFCNHDWKVDKKVEVGEKFSLFVKCTKCDKRTTKRMSIRSMRV